MNELAEVLSGALGQQKQTGSDYMAKVTRVEGQTAYVQITGSDIADTPVSKTINCKPGDDVRVRVADGKAWVTGNDTAPPTDDAKVEKALSEISAYIAKTLSASNGDYSTIKQTVDQILLEVGNKMNKDMGNRASSIIIQNGLIQFLSNTIKITSSKFSLDENGNATFAGSLNAASGSFKGSLIFPWASSVTKNVYINDTTKGSPIVVYGVGEGGLGAIETVIQSGYIEVSQDYQSKSAQLTPTGVQTFSDVRLKEDVKSLDPELAKRLRPVQFRYKGSKDIEYGFIAQEVQKIIPSAVNKGMDSKYLMLNYQELIAPLCALVQEQDERITQLEKKLEALEEKLNEYIKI